MADPDDIRKCQAKVVVTPCDMHPRRPCAKETSGPVPFCIAVRIASSVVALPQRLCTMVPANMSRRGMIGIRQGSRQNGDQGPRFLVMGLADHDTCLSR